jgi:SAM-dependent methyltransferase
MPYDFHSNTEAYLSLLYRNAEKSIIPFIEKHLPKTSGSHPWKGIRILELGCGEGGNLKPFAEKGAICTGFDLNKEKIIQGNILMKPLVDSGNLELFSDDIFNPELMKKFAGQYDLIILKDVIEHIPNKLEALQKMRSYMKETGLLFIGWPPWAMPFGGHQQICHSKLLKAAPWIHLLPKSIYVGLLKSMKEPKEVYEELAEVYDYRVPTRMMKNLVKEASLTQVDRLDYLINPIYEDKFGFKTRTQFGFIKAIPFVNDLLTTSVYLLLKKK